MNDSLTSAKRMVSNARNSSLSHGTSRASRKHHTCTERTPYQAELLVDSMRQELRFRLVDGVVSDLVRAMPVEVVRRYH